MIYLENDTNNTMFLTLKEAALSGTNEYLLYLKNDEVNTEFYCVISASTSNDRYDEISFPLSATSDYFYGIPTQASGQYSYDAYELHSGITSAITSEMLSASTINISTACTSTTIIETGRILIDKDTLNKVTKEYTPNKTGYIGYK